MPAPVIRLDTKHIIDMGSSALRADGLRVWVGGEPGSGKSSACMLVAAQYLEQGGQMLVIDPHGEYGALWGVRPGGRSRIMAFGYGGYNKLIDLPSKPTKAQLADAVQMASDLVMHHLEDGRSVLINLREHTVTEPALCAKLVGELVKLLYGLRMRVPGSTLMLLEEAHLFVPQAQGEGDAPNIKSFLSALTGGRKFGLHFLLASQSQSLVDSNVVKQCNVRLFLRISEQKDWKKVVRDYIPPKLNVTWAKNSKTDLAKFEPGEAVLLCRWFDAARIRLDQSTIELPNFQERST